METLDEMMSSFLNEKYEREAEDLKALVISAYNRGVTDGKESAKAEIIGMIKGEWK